MKTRRAAKADPKLYPPLPTHPATGTSRRSHGGSPPVLPQGETSRKRGQQSEEEPPAGRRCLQAWRGGGEAPRYVSGRCFFASCTERGCRHRDRVPLVSLPAPKPQRSPLSPPPSSVPLLGSQPKDSVVTILIIALYHPNNKHISIINLAEATARGQLHLPLQLTPGLCGSQPLWGRDRRDGKK